MININDFNRARELINRIDDLIGLAGSSFEACRDTYSKISKDFEGEGLKDLIAKFCTTFYSQNKVIIDNLNALNTFLNTQTTEYEKINQEAEARFQQTESEFDTVADNASSQIGMI